MATRNALNRPEVNSLGLFGVVDHKKGLNKAEPSIFSLIQAFLPARLQKTPQTGLNVNSSGPFRVVDHEKPLKEAEY